MVGRRKPTRSHSGEAECCPGCSRRWAAIGSDGGRWVFWLACSVLRLACHGGRRPVGWRGWGARLYAFAAGSLAFAAFGANRFMSVAADSTIAPIFAGGLASLAAAGTPHYAELVTLLALMVGGILLVV